MEANLCIKLNCISSPYSNANAYLARKDDEFDVNARTYEYIPEMPPPPAMRMPQPRLPLYVCRRRLSDLLMQDDCMWKKTKEQPVQKLEWHLVS